MNSHANALSAEKTRVALHQTGSIVGMPPAHPCTSTIRFG